VLPAPASGCLGLACGRVVGVLRGDNYDGRFVLPHEAMFPSGIAIASRKCSLQEIALTDYSLRDWGPRSGAGGDAERYPVARQRRDGLCPQAPASGVS